MAYYTRTRTRPPDAIETFTPILGGSFGASMSDVHNRRMANNECSATTRRVLTNIGVFRMTAPPRYGGYTYTKYASTRACMGSGYCAASPLVSPPGLEDVMKRLNESVCDYIREAGRSSFHAISFIREVESTIAMLKNPFRVVDFVRAHASAKSKRGTFKNALRSAHSNSPKKLANAASNAWLEGTYGWNPFVSDVLAIADLVNGAIASRRRAIKSPPQAFAFPVSSRSSAGADSTSWGSYQPYRYTRTAMEVSIKGKYYGTFRVNPSIEAESYMASVARCLNLDRIGYALWDAVPYSFVVDWFTNLGDQIDNKLSGPAFYSYVDTPWLSYRTKTRLIITVGPTPGWYGQYDGTPSGTGTYSEEVISFERHPGAIDQLALTAQNGMRGQRIASGIALAWGLISRR